MKLITGIVPLARTRSASRRFSPRRLRLLLRLARAVILPSRSLVQDQLSKRARIVGIPHRVHDLTGRGKQRTRLREQRVVALVDPAQAITRLACPHRLSDRLAVREPRKIHAARDRQTDPLPDPRVHIEEQMLLPRGVQDELDLADPVIAERLQDRASALDDLRDLLADHQATRTEALGVLLELAPDERPADLAVGRDVRAERIKATGRNVDDLLRDAGEIRGLAREPD